MNGVKLGITFWILLLVVFLIQGCTHQHTHQSAHPHLDEVAEQPDVERRVLRVYNWEDYFAPGTLEAFEEEFNVDVELYEFETDDEIVSALQSDPTAYDVIFPASEVLGQLIDLRLVQPLQIENIPNFRKNIDEAFLNNPVDVNNDYAVPYLWSTSGVVYNTKYVNTSAITGSWNDLINFEPKNRLAILDSKTDVIAVGLSIQGHSINSLDPAALEQARDIVAKFVEPQVHLEDVIAMRDGLINETYWMAMIWSGDASFAMWENEHISYFHPVEGAGLDTDRMAIPAGAKEVELAHEFINYIYRPKVHADQALYSGYPTVNKASYERGYLDELRGDPLFDPNESVVANFEYWEALDESEVPSHLTRNGIWAYLLGQRAE